jgi:hypothetical protein
MGAELRPGGPPLLTDAAIQRAKAYAPVRLFPFAPPHRCGNALFSIFRVCRHFLWSAE